jgi:AraC-like DNA-binding protein/quercetin dioxygenase-like cupin family protein
MTRRSQPERRPPGPPDFFSPDVAKARRFYLDLNPPRSCALAVVSGGLEHTTPGYAIHRATFPFYSIEFVARGHGEVTLNGRRHPLEPGRLFAYGPGVSQDIVGDPIRPLVKYFVDFAGWQARRLLRECGISPGQVSQVFPPNALQALFDELIESGLRGRRDSRVLCARLLECLALKIGVACAPVEGVNTPAFKTYHQCRQHIEQHFRRLRTLEEIGVECRASSAYLCRLFRRYDQQSPYQYLLRLKMNAATEQLLQPGTLIKEVATQVGFNDPFHFSRVFRSVMGLSPAAFQRLR